MTDREQAAALRLADNLENLEATGSDGDYFALTEWSQRRALEAASELRRLHAENKALMNLLRRAQPAQAVPLLSDAEIEPLAVAHEDFGFGRVDSHGLTTHGFSPEGLRFFVNAIEQAVRAKMGIVGKEGA